MKNQLVDEQDRSKYLFLFLVLFVVILIRSAWICDDAYITLRTVDNLYNGYGLTWNAGQRVQAYTHPLWLGVVAVTYFLFENPYYLLISLSIVISSLVLFLLLTRLATSPTTALLGLLMLAEGGLRTLELLVMA